MKKKIQITQKSGENIPHNWSKNIPQEGQKIFRYWIGIDTGVKTGFAVWDKVDKTLDAVETVQIHKAIEDVRRYVEDHPGTVFVRVEDARLRKWLPKTVGKEQLQGAGSIKRDATIWEGFLKSIDADFEMVAPKNNKTKLSPEYFKKLTGWKKLTSNHGRDAAMLVFGK